MATAKTKSNKRPVSGKKPAKRERGDKPCFSQGGLESEKHDHITA